LETRSGAFAPSVLGCRNRSMRPRRTSSRLAVLNIGRIAAPEREREREREAREVVREEGNRTPGFPGNPDCEGAFRLRRGVSLLTPQVSTRRPSPVCRLCARPVCACTRERHVYDISGDSALLPLTDCWKLGQGIAGRASPHVVHDANCPGAGTERHEA